MNTQKIFKKLALYILLISIGCGKNDDNKQSDLSKLEDIATFHGNMNGDIVVIHSQGGPETTLNDSEVQEAISSSGTSNALWVNVHQVQTKDPSQFTRSDITFEQAKTFNKQTIANLKRVVDFFKNLPDGGKTIYILGVSFGAFVIQELIAIHGVDVADGFLISVGRLDIDDEAWIAFSEGKFGQFVYDASRNYTIKIQETNEAVDRNMARLAAGIGFNRYTTKLNGIGDLSKITYVWGNRDEAVGPLSQEEQDFLTKKGATVVLESLGDHDAAIEKTFSILKTTFNIE